MAGKIPFASSFSVFLLNKGFEQLRVTAAYPNVNLKIVGTHSGISIGEDGPSQMSIEDLSLACSLPGFTVMSPADEVATKASGERGRRSIRADVHPRRPPESAGDLRARTRSSTIGKAIQLIDGSDVTLIATGLMVAESIRAAETLEAEGISARVIDIHTIKPLDRDAIARAAAETGAIVVAEEHLVDAGLGVRVAQVVAETHPAVMEFVGIDNTYAESATPDQLLDKYGLRARECGRRGAPRHRPQALDAVT